MSIPIILYQAVIALLIIGAGFTGDFKALVIITLSASAWTLTHVILPWLMILQFSTIIVSTIIGLVLCVIANIYKVIPQGQRTLAARVAIIILLEMALLLKLYYYMDIYYINMFLDHYREGIAIFIFFVYIFLELLNKKISIFNGLGKLLKKLFGISLIILIPATIIWLGAWYIINFGHDGIGEVVITIGIIIAIVLLRALLVNIDG